MVAALLIAVLVAGGLWLRDSSLVAVRHVEVTGLTGSQQQEIRSALEHAASSMTTLHVREDALRAAVAPFSIVKDIEVAPDFPRTLRIHVVSNVAVGVVELAGRRTPVTADGRVLADVAAADDLPLVPLERVPAGRRLDERDALEALAVLGAAPRALRTRIARVASSTPHGLELHVAPGPVLRFGDGTRANAKWAAAAAVLADDESAGASYVDVTAPERPAVGGLPDGAPAPDETEAIQPTVSPDATGDAPQ